MIYDFDLLLRTLEPITAPRRPPLWSFNNLLPLHTPFKIRLGVPLSYKNPGSRSGKSHLLEQPGIPRCSPRPFWTPLDVPELPTKDLIDCLTLSWSTRIRQFLKLFCCYCVHGHEVNEILEPVSFSRTKQHSWPLRNLIASSILIDKSARTHLNKPSYRTHTGFSVFIRGSATGRECFEKYFSTRFSEEVDVLSNAPDYNSF